MTNKGAGPFHAAPSSRPEAQARPALTRHLDQNALACRWGVSPRTLERWRWRKTGPCYIKLGGKVAYRLTDILSYEAAQLHEPAPAPDPFFRKVR